MQRHFLDMNRGSVGRCHQMERDMMFLTSEEAADRYCDDVGRDPLEILIELEEHGEHELMA